MNSGTEQDLDQIEQEVRQALLDGKSAADCPYPEGHPARFSWLWELEVHRRAPYVQAGQLAAEQGCPITGCPAGVDQQLQHAWVLGWQMSAPEGKRSLSMKFDLNLSVDVVHNCIAARAFISKMDIAVAVGNREAEAFYRDMAGHYAYTAGVITAAMENTDVPGMLVHHQLLQEHFQVGLEDVLMRRGAAKTASQVDAPRQ